MRKTPVLPPLVPCTPAAWLRHLTERAVVPELNLCRYMHRRGAFDGTFGVLQEHLITFVEQGRLEGTVDGERIALRPGDLFWIPPGCARQYRNPPGAPRTRQYNLRFRLRRGRGQLACLSAPRHLHHAWEAQDAFQKLLDLHVHGHPYAECRLRALLLVLSTTVFGAERPAAETEEALPPALRARLDRIMVDHIAEGIEPADLAAELDLSLDYFTRRFRATYGKAPRYYLKHLRMRLAAVELLETNRTAAHIARELGMRNPSLFCRQFRQVHGCTPGEYRRREAG